MVARTLNAARVYLGTMNFGWAQASAKCDTPVAAEMLRRFAKYGGNRLDTARIYTGGQGESHVREAIERSGISDWRLGSKAAPSADQGLSPEGIHGQFDASRNALQMDGALDEYFLHQPDPLNSLEATLQTLDVLVGMNVVREVGLSNFHVDEVKRAFDICEEYGLAFPTVYQGLYNPLNRLVEDDLLPFLRERNCKFVAYNGLAAGLLTGKHRQGTDVLNGRFKNNENYLPRFYTESNFEAVRISASRRVETPSRHRRDSCPSDEVVGGLFFEFKPFRTASSDRDAPRRWSASALPATKRMYPWSRRPTPGC